MVINVPSLLKSLSIQEMRLVKKENHKGFTSESMFMLVDTLSDIKQNIF